ncbi:MAG: DUF58 domain-containing protein [Chloroflexota bacterium]|nr:MAG: DUF58 domain-containing protein [Chloroflexota bacterium]
MTPAGWRILGLTVALLAIGLIGRMPLPLTIAGAFALVLTLGLVWSGLSARALIVERRCADETPSVGDTLTEHLRVTNRGWLPSAVAIEPQSTLPGYGQIVSLTIGSRGTATRTLAFRCATRGEFTLGPTRIRAFDPFGLCQASRVESASRRVIVLPAIESSASGDRRAASGAPEIAPDAAAIRDYQAGDPVRRIHWPSTARLGRLVVKEVERSGSTNVLVVADLDASVQVGVCPDGTEERVVGVAASVAAGLIEARRAVALIATANRHLDVRAGRGERHIQSILESLAVARAGRSPALEEVLLAEIGRLSRDTTLIVVTPSIERAWVAALARAGPRGIPTFALLVEPATYGDAASSLDVVGDLLSNGTPVALVKRDRTLIEALADA